jgi:hypothetical protein
LIDDPVYGQVAFGEFWQSWGDADAPAIMRASGIAPEEFYSKEYFARVIGENEGWLKQEKALLRQ